MTIDTKCDLVRIIKQMLYVTHGILNCAKIEKNRTLFDPFKKCFPVYTLNKVKAEIFSDK